MNKKLEEIDDIDVLRFKYASLRSLHRVANANNDSLNEDNNKLRGEVNKLKEINSGLSKQVIDLQVQLAEVYNQNNIDNQKNIELIQQLQSEIRTLKNNND